MKDITNDFGTLYHPETAFVVYRQAGGNKQVYIESYDIGSDGFPINAHPLSIRESKALAKIMSAAADGDKGFLKPEGLLPKGLLYLNSGDNGYAVWHTPPQARHLLFIESLGIPDGPANLPALIWKASREQLSVYALAGSGDMGEQAELYHAPFFNIYKNGGVCMGTVSINISRDCSLENFIGQWERYFFTSYFSHLLQGHNPVKGNIVQLWQSLTGAKKKFPLKRLIKNGLTIKNLIV